MKKIIFASSLIALSAVFVSQFAYADEGGQFSLSAGMDYNTGKYGGTQSTDILYIPITGKYQARLWSMKVTVPYLRITGPSNVLNNVGAVGAPGTVSTRSGLGDVILSGSRSVYYDEPAQFLVNLTGKVKLGTADSTKGLGTGQNDYTMQVDLYKLLGRLTAFGMVGYKVYGQPAAYTLYNAFFVSAGGSYKLDDQTNAGILFNEGQKTTLNGSSHTEAIVFADQRLDKSRKMQYYLQKGFTKSVPDFGLGVSLFYYF